MFCHLKYISFYLTIKVQVFLSLFHVKNVKYLDHVVSTCEIRLRVKRLCSFKSSCLGLTILKIRPTCL